MVFNGAIVGVFVIKYSKNRMFRAFVSFKI